MASTNESIAQRLPGALDALSRQGSQVEGAQPSIRDTEEQLGVGMLAVGRGLMPVRFNDRFEQAGLRWSLAGAQTLLDWPSVAFNDDGDDFQRFRRRPSPLERDDFPYPDVLPDIVAVEAAA